MTCRVMLATLVVGLVVAPVAGAATSGVAIDVDRTSISTALGHEFRLTTTIANRGSSVTPSLVAHLNVLSLRPGIYVDPEDWSSHRTDYLGSIPAGESRRIIWKLKAVNDGSLAAYVTVLPQDGRSEAPTIGTAVHIAVAKRNTLNSGGVLPLAAGLPAALAALALGARLRQRRR